MIGIKDVPDFGIFDKGIKTNGDRMPQARKDKKMQKLCKDVCGHAYGMRTVHRPGSATKKCDGKPNKGFQKYKSVHNGEKQRGRE